MLYTHALELRSADMSLFKKPYAMGGRIMNEKLTTYNKIMGSPIKGRVTH